MTTDEVFKTEIKQASDFKFNTQVVDVFDNMVSRSVPCYGEIQRMIAEVAADHVLPDTFVYDLGCSTGATMLEMDRTIDPAVKFIGIDDSPEMLQKCKANLNEAGCAREVDLNVANLNQHLEIKNASVVVLCLTLQFVRPIYREKLLQQISAGLKEGGILILVEKVLAEESLYNRNFIKYYYEFKRRNAYSELEISQKREALENVLVPYKVSENILMLKECGFGHTEIFFKWYNFCGIIAEKQKP